MYAAHAFPAARPARNPADAIRWAQAQHPGILRPAGFLTLVALGEAALPALAEAMDLCEADTVFALTPGPVLAMRLTAWAAAPVVPVLSGPDAAAVLDRSLGLAWPGDQVVILAPLGHDSSRITQLKHRAAPAEVFVVSV